MDDKNLMENILNMSKTLVGLYMHASVESYTPDVHTLFTTVLDEAICMQNEVYNAMSENGWYKTETAEEKQINKTIQKYANQ